MRPGRLAEILAPPERRLLPRDLQPVTGPKDRAQGPSRMAIPDSTAAVRSPSKRNRGEMDRTIEQRLMSPLHWVEKSIRRFRVDWPGVSPRISRCTMSVGP